MGFSCNLNKEFQYKMKAIVFTDYLKSVCSIKESINSKTNLSNNITNSLIPAQTDYLIY